jgi:hypothetical protein
MRTGLKFSAFALVVFLVTAVAGADVRLSAASWLRQEPDKQKALSGLVRTMKPGTYRSPTRVHKVVIQTDQKQELELARSSGAIELADYGSFKLFLFDQQVLDREEPQGTAGGIGDLISPHGLSSQEFDIAVRDDFNLLLLRAGPIDTTTGEAPGQLLGHLARWGAAIRQSGAEETSLRLIQFIGPIKDEWLERLEASGFEPIAYVPNNGYLVQAHGLVSAQVERSDEFIQWEGPFLAEYKIHPALAADVSNPPHEMAVAVQFARGQRESADQIVSQVNAVKRLASSVIGDAYEVLNFTNLKIRIDPRRIIDVAVLSGVVNIEPWSPPEMFDERASQIVAGALSDDGKEARGPGYLAWLQSKGFSGTFGFAIDFSDSGLDRGSTVADKLHSDFLDGSGRSRVAYARDYTSELDPGDVPGHGTLNASVGAGANVSAEKGMRDSADFNYGLGVAPFALIGSSKIFQSNGRFDLIEPYTTLVSDAYGGGARISSNSWGSAANEYTIESQEYDARARDAVPSQPGNQEMVICFAAGNGGPGGRIGSPGTGKNVISVGASENSRKTGTDGCGVMNDSADNALDIAYFSAGGEVYDGRLKPDLAAPGTHIQGAASQHPEFDGSGVCGEDFESPYFPLEQTLYTWSSGTSHSTPQVAGAATLMRQFFLNRGDQPSAALIKAFLLNTTTYMTGERAGGDLPHERQGWGLLNIGRAFDSAPKVFVDQTTTLGESGQEFVMTGEVRDSSLPFRVTLAWSDAPGLSAFVPWVNDLDLEVTINGQVYRGNNLRGQQSEPGGEPNTKDNVEAVWLPAGTVGSFLIRVRAANIAGDGVPGNSDSTDQDFALVVYNGERKEVAVGALAGVNLIGGADAFADPGETVSMRIALKNVSPVAMSGAAGQLSSATQGITVETATAGFPDIGPGATGEGSTAFTFAVGRSVPCGSVIQFVLDVTSQGSRTRLPFSVTVGNPRPAEMFADDVESGEAKWTHGSGIKKKKQRVDTWTISTRRFRSGSSSWFTPNPARLVDAHLDTVPIQLPADGRNLFLVFYHTFEFEPPQFDGAVLEISTGEDFEDLGPKVLRGRYNGTIRDITSNPLAGRPGWVDGRLGQFQQVVVDVSSYAGKTVVIRFRIGTDANVKGQGWYIDDVSISGERVSCTPAT